MSFAAGCASPAALAAPGPTSNPFALVSITAAHQRRQLTVTLELPGPGALRLSVTAARKTLASVTRVESAKTSREPVVLKLKPAPQGILGARGSETLNVTITFVPTGGKSRTMTKTITLAPTEK